MILTVMTKSGEAHVKIDHVVAIVKQGAFVENEYVTPSQHTLSLDLHMQSGTIFTVPNTTEEDIEMILAVWKRAIHETTEE